MIEIFWSRSSTIDAQPLINKADRTMTIFAIFPIWVSPPMVIIAHRRPVAK